MNHKLLTRGLLATSIALASSAQAADVRINGFASIAVGKSFSQTKLPDGSETTYNVDPNYATSNESFYDDDISFNPDTNYGIQFSSDLGGGLSVTAQFTGKGSNDFETELEWAYASYALNNNWTIQGGKMRIPLYHYSDFLDVGYAYHWLRAPVDVYAEGVSTYQGIALRYNTYLGDWDINTSLHAGNGGNDDSDAGDISLDNYVGLVVNATYDWLQLRAAHHLAEQYVDYDLRSPAPTGAPTDDDPGDIAFTSAAIFAHFEKLFLGAEWTFLDTPDDDYPLFSDNAPFITGERQAYMITAGYRMGSWTPHITYTDRVITLDKELNPAHPFSDKEIASDSIIVGVRWDFHPAAAIKFEYVDRSDDTDDYLVKTAGIGKVNEVSNFAMSLDLIF